MAAKSKLRTAEPVYPNAGVETWYRETLQWRIVRPMARDMLATIKEVWTEAGGVVEDAKKISAPPSQSVLLQRALGKWGTKWTQKVERMSDTIARDFALKNAAATDRAMLAKLKKAGFAVKFKASQTSVAALDNVIAYNVGLIKSIPQQFLTDVQTAVYQAVMAGSDLKTLTETISEKYGVAWRRAEFIALDQNNKAKAAMEKARRLEVGIKQARWRHSGAGKEPRPTHVKAGEDGVIYDIEKGWFDPAIQKYIWPGTEPRCKCVDEPIIPGFS